MDKKLAGAVSISGARDYLGGLGKTKLYELINRGDIPVLRIDSKPVILIEDLDEYLARLSKEASDRRKAS